jgi:hypothetical protein
MSSATSTEFRLKADAAGKAKRAEPPRADVNADAGFRAWHFFILAALAASTIAVLMSRQSAPEHLILISLTIAAAGAAAAGFYRMLAPFALEDVSVLDDPPSERARAALEREKSLVLRSIKELEFDKAMGKVSSRDFDEMAGRLRARAVMLMKQLDEGGSAYRELVERELKTRLKASGRAGLQPSVSGGADLQGSPREAGLKAGATVGGLKAGTADTACACGTLNDPDAAFCKRCGTKLEAVHS